MPAVLQEYQYELVAGEHSVVFGRNTSYTVAVADHTSVEESVADAVVSGGDGIRFGRDFINGRIITFDLNVLTPYTAGAPQSLSTLEEFAARWRNDWIRTKAGEVCELRYRIGGRTRKVYGRPRKFAATTGRAHQGWIPATAEFQCIDDKYYDDVPISEVVPMSNAGTNGRAYPREYPYTYGTHGETRPSVINVEGSVAAVPVIKIFGPIINPEVQQVGGWRIKFPGVTLLFDQSITIDPRHWVRAVYRENDTNMAGKMDAASPTMSQMWLEPGEHQLVLKGIDPTARARLEVQAHFAHASY
jgi:hypothetical protein